MAPLTLPGTMESLDSLIDYVLAAAEAAGLDKKATYQLRLAVDEIATNIVLHGYNENGRTGDVSVEAEIQPDSLRITLEDTAVQYNPLESLLPNDDDLGKPMEERPIGGLGVFLAIQGVSKFDYEWKEPHNRNIFIVNRQNDQVS